MAWIVSTSLLELLQPLEGTPEGLDLWSYKLIDAQRASQGHKREAGGERGHLARRISATNWSLERPS